MYRVNSPLMQPAMHFCAAHTLIQAFSRVLNALSNLKWTRLQDDPNMLDFSSKINKVDKVAGYHLIS